MRDLPLDELHRGFRRRAVPGDRERRPAVGAHTGVGGVPLRERGDRPPVLLAGAGLHLGTRVPGTAQPGEHRSAGDLGVALPALRGVHEDQVLIRQALPVRGHPTGRGVGEREVPGTARGVEPARARLPRPCGEMGVAVRGEQCHPALVPLAAHRPRGVLELLPGARDGQSVPLEEVGAVMHHHRLYVERYAEHPLLEGGQPQGLRQQLGPQAVAHQAREVTADPVDGEAGHLGVLDGRDVRGVPGPCGIAELCVAALTTRGDLLEIDLDGVVPAVERVHDLLAAPQGGPEGDACLPAVPTAHGPAGTARAARPCVPATTSAGAERARQRQCGDRGEHVSTALSTRHVRLPRLLIRDTGNTDRLIDSGQ